MRLRLAGQASGIPLLYQDTAIAAAPQCTLLRLVQNLRKSGRRLNSHAQQALAVPCSKVLPVAGYEEIGLGQDCCGQHRLILDRQQGFRFQDPGFGQVDDPDLQEQLA
jgi:hypothetical protein